MTDSHALYNAYNNISSSFCENVSVENKRQLPIINFTLEKEHEYANGCAMLFTF